METKNIKPIFEIGDIVAITSHPNLNQAGNWALGNHNSKEFDAPFMLVIEVNHNPKPEHIFDEKTSKQVSSHNKYLCQWFDFELGQVKDAWFLEPHLTQFQHHISSVNIESLSLGTVLTLKTRVIEVMKQFANEMEPSKSRYINRFISPLFFVKGFEKVDSPKLYDTKLENCLIKEVSSIKIKCGWYNTRKGTYSEEFIPLDSLSFLYDEITVKHQTLSKDAGINVDEFSDHYPDYRSSMKMLEEDDKFSFQSDSFEKERQSGSRLHHAAFLYLSTKGKNRRIISHSVLNRLLKEYIDRDSLLFNLFIKDDARKVYSQVDLLIPQDNGKYVLVDIIGSLTIERPCLLIFKEKIKAETKDINELLRIDHELTKYWLRLELNHSILKNNYDCDIERYELWIVNNDLIDKIVATPTNLSQYFG
ncbi:hypothetical protein SAMN05216323_102931 [Williamwhitmania taraxaci]|uniref:Uncharacterized protein n=2 Tax=Williamwhitmania taraxaci TaxID=1640674 RepID=A0A1G6L7J5_9BACT|nr:hypothetical protein SAMN05216323_102931 [Williamwhitmania taraxaci]